jgi:Predicted membrane protein
MKDYLPLILGMTAATYLPRLLPLILLTERPLPPAVRRFLLYIPYTALSALIIRGILQSNTGMVTATLIGISIAGICSWFKGGLVISVAASIISALLVLHGLGI